MSHEYHTLHITPTENNREVLDLVTVLAMELVPLHQSIDLYM